MALADNSNAFSYVVVEPLATNTIKLFQAAPIDVPPVVSIQGGTALTGTCLGLGKVTYTGSIAATGSAQTINMQIPKAHTLLRVEFSQVVTSTGAPDATGLAAAVARINKISPATGAAVLQNQSKVTQADIVMVFGPGWESDKTTYQFQFTGQNNDTLTFSMILEYI